MYSYRFVFDEAIIRYSLCEHVFIVEPFFFLKKSYVIVQTELSEKYPDLPIKR